MVESVLAFFQRAKKKSEKKKSNFCFNKVESSEKQSYRYKNKFLLYGD